MFCPQCGKEIDPKSRFCYMCGAAVVVPKEKKEEKTPAPQVPKEEFVPFTRTGVKLAPVQETEPVRPIEEEDDDVDFKPYVRAKYRGFERPSHNEEEEAPAQREEPAPKPQEEYHPHLSRDAQDIPYVSAKRVPPKPSYASTPLDEDDFDDADDYDEYDDYDDGDEDYDYEEPEKEGFFSRHIVGIIMLFVVLIVLTVGAVFVMSDSGQALLAKANIAWKPEAYATAGTQAYGEESYLSAGSYFEKALKMEPNNYDYAYRSAVSYYNGDDAADAERLSRAAIALNPDKADAYIILQRLYPNANTRPEEITRLLQDGYTRTGNSAIIGR